MPGRAAAGQGIRVLFRRGYRGAASRLLLGLPVCAQLAPTGLYGSAAEGEGTRWRTASALKGLAEGDWGWGSRGGCSVLEFAVFWFESRRGQGGRLSRLVQLLG